MRDQHEKVLAHAGQGIVGVDADGAVVVANPAAGALTGWREDGLLGRDLHATLHPRAADGGPCTDPQCAVVRAALDGHEVLRRRDVLWRRDATTFPAQVSSAPMVDAGSGEVTGAVLVFDDVTEQQTVDRMKDEFVSVVSHELRTPLTSLRGSLGLLAAGVLGDLSVQGQQMADIAVSSTERLVRLVDDILDLERLVAGQVVLERRAHRLTDVAQAAVDAVAALAETAGIAVLTEVDAAEAWLDADRVVQVLVNLLGNAVKFSAPGSQVVLRVRRDPVSVLLEVEDPGRGIPAEHLERVFERFAQVDSSDRRDRGGSGLGLAIARNVVEAHGGTIAVRSEVGVGTTMTAVLPQRRADAPPRPAGRRAVDGAA